MDSDAKESEAEKFYSERAKGLWPAEWDYRVYLQERDRNMRPTYADTAKIRAETEAENNEFGLSAKEQKFMNAGGGAELVAKDITFYARRDDDNVFYFDDNAGFYRVARDFLNEKAVSLKGDFLKSDFATNLNKNVAWRNYEPVPELPLELIPVKNGLLNVLTNEVTDHTDAFFYNHALPVEYNPSAKCPAIDKFLTEVLEPDHALTMTEFAGFCLYRRYFMEKALMSVGGGANGKSIYSAVLTAMLGSENVTNMTLQRICIDRFAPASLYGKLLNISGDLPPEELEDAGMFKTLTGDDEVQAEFKFQRSFKFRNHAKMLFQANQIPRTRDRSIGYMRRFQIVPWQKEFLDNPDLRLKLLDALTAPAELEGFLLKAVAGLKNMLTTGKFTHQQSVQDVTEQYLEASEPITAFVHIECEEIEDVETPKTEIYSAYAGFCRDRHFVPDSDMVFHRNLIKIANVEATRPTIDKTRVHCWKGIKLKSTPIKTKKEAKDGQKLLD